MFTEVSQNNAPREPVIIPQSELKKFQELEIEDDQPVTENNEAADSETELAENEKMKLVKLLKQKFSKKERVLEI